ncbi:hypothetical protein [Pseudoxanthomonas suwonensis]|uniref:DUF3604 domain-containing protein n=1 Tax=Pseudoxanthomonas suwonensis TaxID=314722 RepID=A0A0E3Z1U4_9GAMM|nr:hypothetical protein [Pseudoxanthomonas suwonensis]AKC86937.1 hypothetical protein WQ53_09410 [Pseudoxanthomonas suwonensis]
MRRIASLSLFLLLAVCSNVSAGNGQEGTFEFAIDAPWRIEPVVDQLGNRSYGAIPIIIAVTDANIIPFDNPDDDRQKYRIGNFCELKVFGAGGTWRQNIGFEQLSEIEHTGHSGTTWKTGAWGPGYMGGNESPSHRVCKPGEPSCASSRTPHGTSEWYATAWYTPVPADGFVPGADLPLTLTAIFTTGPEVSCDSVHDADFLSLTNHVSVHAGEAPLPRFDDRWAYGDLHYHSQGTDNEGEQGYGYRGTLKAMGAIGLDFAFATEHASDSLQIVDVDFDGYGPMFIGGIQAGFSDHPLILRDMSAPRFRFLHGELWRPQGANLDSAFRGSSPSLPPQTVRARRIAPQIFLGGEVDVVPEVGANDNSTSWSYAGGQISLNDLCGGWKHPITDCNPSRLREQRNGATILKDVQGINEYHPARAHMVYLPRDAARADAFVSSRTGRYGGASRQMTKGSDALLPEIEAGGDRGKGYVFLAHPIPFGNCDGGPPNLRGGPGPDVVPYTKQMLDQAFRSRAVLGLQLWNEDVRMLNRSGDGDTTETGFHSDDDDGGYGFRNSPPGGFADGAFELQPWHHRDRPSYARHCEGVEWMLTTGTRLWDQLMLKGLSPSETASIDWLPAGDPRRLFMAGGSDAHGDLNHHRAGYMLGLERVDDMAIGKPRNLVMAGKPQTALNRLGLSSSRHVSPRGREALADNRATTAGVENSTGGAGATGPTGVPAATSVLDDQVNAYSQSQIVAALAEGAFSVTDGPALRIAIDRNGNGRIDDADTPMGGIIETYGDVTLPLLVEWQSNEEWGPVYQVDLIVGISTPHSAAGRFEEVFAPFNNGPRTRLTQASEQVEHTRKIDDNRTFVKRRGEYYYDDPTGGLMRFQPASFSGTRRIDLPLQAFSVRQAIRGGRLVLPERMFVRAYARSVPMVGSSGTCAVDPKIGRCIPRYAFANPVWAIAGPGSATTCPRNRPRAIDSDGDGLPDGCDPCPHTSQSFCPPAPRDRPPVLREDRPVR